MTNWAEACAAGEPPRVRAVRLLRELVPQFTTRADALDHLYHDDPFASDALRLLAIGAALHILKGDG